MGARAYQWSRNSSAFCDECLIDSLTIVCAAHEYCLSRIVSSQAFNVIDSNDQGISNSCYELYKLTDSLVL